MSAADTQTFDPFRSFRFEVNVSGQASGTQIGFQKVSGLKESTDVVEYREGNMPIHKRKLPGLTNYDPITLTRGSTNSPFLLDWRAKVALFATNKGYGDGVPADITAQAGNGGASLPAVSAGGTGFRRSVAIKLYDKGTSIDGGLATTGSAVRHWILRLAWPSEYAVSDLNAEASEVLIDTLVLQHEGLQIVKPKVNTAATA